MSFLGCIEYIVDGSGLKEVLSKMYAPNSIDKMLDGYAFARSVRGHTLLRLALSMIIFEDIKFENYDELDVFIARVLNCDFSYENISNNTESYTLANLLQDKLNELKAKGNTAQLWMQYYEMVSIALDFIRAERLGNFKEHLDAVNRMLPFSHASGHFLYAKSTHFYIQDMKNLKNAMDPTSVELGLI